MSLSLDLILLQFNVGFEEKNLSDPTPQQVGHNGIHNFNDKLSHKFEIFYPNFIEVIIDFTKLNKHPKA